MATKGPRNRMGQYYDWDKWLKIGTTSILKYGKDYQCTTNSMAVNLRLACARKQYNVSASVSIIDNETIKITVHGVRGEPIPSISLVKAKPKTLVKPAKISKK